MPQPTPNSAQELLLRAQRQQVTDQIRGRFARYGDEVCQTILTAALQQGGLQQVLAQLKLAPTPLYAEQLERLNRYLSGMGGAEFMRALKQATPQAKAGAGLVNPFERPGVAAEQPEAAVLAETLPAAPRSAAPRSAAPRSAAPKSAAPKQDTSDDLMAMALRMLETQPMRGKHAADTEPATPRGPYNGPERRSGQDRREAIDRRLRIDAIGRNKRFGGDRRKSGRRKSDH